MSYTQFTRGRGASVVCNLQRKGKLRKQRPMANLISQVKHGVKTAPTHASTHGVAFQRSDVSPKYKDAQVRHFTTRGAHCFVEQGHVIDYNNT